MKHVHMIKYIPKTKMTNIFYETLQNAILGQLRSSVKCKFTFHCGAEQRE